MAVDGIYYDPGTKNPVVMLTEEGGARKLPIWIGAFEAMSILLAMEKTEVPRPITHDLTAELLRRLGATVERVEVSKIVDGVYYAELKLVDSAGKSVAVDSRPSDALALAVRFDAEVYASPEVLAAAAKGSPKGDESSEEYWKRFLENLEPEAFGKYRM